MAMSEYSKVPTAADKPQRHFSSWMLGTSVGSGPAYQQRPHRPFACQPTTVADALSDDMLSRASRHRQE